LLPVHASLLHQVAPPLQVGAVEAVEVAEQLYEAARRQADDGERRMVGLAAPQIGVAARAFLFDPRESPGSPWPLVEELRCVVNPTVEPIGDAVVKDMEGCLSTGRIRGWVQRAARVRVCGYTPTGDPINEVHTGLAARVLQHEADHLDGVLFPSQLTDGEDLLWSSVEQDEQFIAYVRAHRQGDSQPWPTRLPRDQWDAARAGLPILGGLNQANSPVVNAPTEMAESPWG
jgi:peptide deformylase